MRENRTYGSEGGEGNLPDPYSRTGPRSPAIDQMEPPVMDSGFRRNDARWQGRHRRPGEPEVPLSVLYELSESQH